MCRVPKFYFVVYLVNSHAMEAGFRDWCSDYVTTQRRYYSDSRTDFCADLLEDHQFPWGGTIVQMTRYFTTQSQRQMFQTVWNIYTQEIMDEEYIAGESSSSEYSEYGEEGGGDDGGEDGYGEEGGDESTSA